MIVEVIMYYSFLIHNTNINIQSLKKIFYFCTCEEVFACGRLREMERIHTLYL